ncbi:MAG: hypothetical protein SGI97_04135 [candidate division Zixibacteria bacterium]|nr:hypothetical protein [candidate division Zixibacteria bacterium]
MSIRDIRFASLLTTLAAVAVFSGCSQPDDVLTPVSTTNLSLKIERLPSPPPGMVYELWVSRKPVRDTNLATSDLRSITRFSYLKDSIESILLDSNYRPVTNSQFTLPADLFDFKSVFVSVEDSANDPDPARPASIMLTDNINGQDDQTLRLNFPLSERLWSTIVRFNMEGITDNNRNLGDGSGIWFSSYRGILDTLLDTFDIENINNSRIDEIVPIIGPPPLRDTLNLTELKAEYVFNIINDRPDTMLIDYGPDNLLIGVDSFQHIFIRYDSVMQADTTYPYTRRDIRFDTRTTLKTIRIDIFSQDNFGLPDYSAWGWQWKGWIVVPPTVATPQNSLGNMTRPAWRDLTDSKNWIPGSNGGLFTTGTFTDITMADDGNPYTLQLFRGFDSTGDSTFKVPNKPGEDFLNSAALMADFGIPSLNFMPNATGNVGTVFISLEPYNRLTDTTNFPLIAFLRELPSNRNEISPPLGRVDLVQVTMFNKTSTVFGTNTGTGFPEISITFSRF